ncbi:MAG: S1 RNA-binding domain-containing protein, partial [Candidatus Kapabacteria bacterium]|nr:S1 RNA-binding domain-containing protein [Candidatus Kapabacteria bacterium]
DLSWTKKIRHPGEFVKKGDELRVIVLSIDSDHRRISLGHKQITDNPWDVFAERFHVGTETEGKIVRIIDKGVIVEMPEGVDGFVPSSQLSFAPVRSIADFFHVGDALPLNVVEFDKEAKKIVLSAVDALKKKDAEAIAAYNAQHPVPNADKYVAEGNAPQIAPEELKAIDAVVADLNVETSPALVAEAVVEAAPEAPAAEAAPEAPATEAAPEAPAAE